MQINKKKNNICKNFLSSALLCTTFIHEKSPKISESCRIRLVHTFSLPRHNIMHNVKVESVDFISLSSITCLTWARWWRVYRMPTSLPAVSWSSLFSYIFRLCCNWGGREEWSYKFTSFKIKTLFHKRESGKHVWQLVQEWEYVPHRVQFNFLIDSIAISN